MAKKLSPELRKLSFRVEADVRQRRLCGAFACEPVDDEQESEKIRLECQSCGAAMNYSRNGWLDKRE